jgi:hypothetical protein
LRRAAISAALICSSSVSTAALSPSRVVPASSAASLVGRRFSQRG